MKRGFKMPKLMHMDMEISSGGGSAEGGTSVPTKLSELENDTNYVTEEQMNSRTEINDAVIGNTSTWSSSKIASEMQWKFLGNLTTAGDLSDVIPDTANEICIVRISDSTIKDFSLILPIIALPNFGTGTNYVDNFIRNVWIICINI